MDTKPSPRLVLVPCSSMTCDCRNCVDERLRLRRETERREPVRQPWQPIVRRAA